ncbi:(2Fe-2S)-binding protein [Aureimonas sp. Leaf454]|uniref:Rieske (2Fe-2S) protein n=1 Tax=Aureimonas sp. Leaf454 TaxID=1736381 RepID=UPI0006FD7DBA|nr:Rieske 2Fe-2S domain-containing protein [Aureimonas sp. Leaf454]KQT44546.1 (2Fe-2S)-binding protein [Aureimonas sp. Leaf454]
MSSDEPRLCHRDDIPVGSARGFLPRPDALRRVIVLNRDNHFVAYVDACPHYTGGTPMAWRSDAYLNGDGTHLACHAHGALFDIDTGACLSGPCLGRNLTPVPLKVGEDGSITVRSISPVALARKRNDTLR